MRISDWSSDVCSSDLVVLYFFPAAFTAGCTIEAHLFAEANSRFNQLGARVIGVTAGNIDRVAEFSRSECRDKFAVAADPGAKVAAKYDTLMEGPNKTPLSDRTSFCIAPGGARKSTRLNLSPSSESRMTSTA